MSDGSLCLVDLLPSGDLKMARTWVAHELEAWIVG